MEKCCTKCKNLLPATNDYFFNNKRTVDGFYSWCKECYKKSRQTLEHKEYVKQYYQKKLEDPEYKKNIYDLNKKSYYKNKDRYKQYRELKKDQNKEYQIKLKFNITLEQYNIMLEQQNHCCDICGLHKSNFTRQLAIDHCHTTGKVRGLLCVHCNLAIGNFKDNTILLNNAINYIQKHSN